MKTEYTIDKSPVEFFGKTELECSWYDRVLNTDVYQQALVKAFDKVAAITELKLLWEDASKKYVFVVDTNGLVDLADKGELDNFIQIANDIGAEIVISNIVWGEVFSQSEFDDSITSKRAKKIMAAFNKTKTDDFRQYESYQCAILNNHFGHENKYGVSRKGKLFWVKHSDNVNQNTVNDYLISIHLQSVSQDQTKHFVGVSTDKNCMILGHDSGAFIRRDPVSSLQLMRDIKEKRNYLINTINMAAAIR